MSDLLPGRQVRKTQTLSNLRFLREIVDAAVSLYRQNFKTMAVIGLAASLPIIPVVGIAGKAGLFTMGNDPQQFMAFTTRFLPLMLLFGALAVLWFSVVDGAMTFAAAEAYHGCAPSPADAIRGAWGKGLSLIAGNLLRFLIIVGVGIAAALAMAIVGRLNPFLAIIIGVTMFVLFAHLLARTFAITSAIVIENRSAGAGVQRSFSLSKNATLRIVGVALLCIVIYWVSQMVLMRVVQLLMQLKITLSSDAPENEEPSNTDERKRVLWCGWRDSNPRPSAP